MNTTRNLDWPLPANTVAHGGSHLLGLFAIRWTAGILENQGLTMASQAAAIVMLAGLGIGFLNRMRLTAVTSLFVAGVVAWMVAAFLSLIANPTTDIRAGAALLTLLLLYGLFANAALGQIRTRAHLRQVARLLAGFVAIGAGLSVLQIASGTGFVEAGKNQIVRAFGSDVHPVSFAIQLVAALTALEVIRAKCRIPVTARYLALLIIGMAALYLTYARTAWVMAVFVVAYVALTHGPPLRRLTLGGVALLLGGGVLLTSSRFADLSSLPFFLENFSFHDTVFDWRYVDNSISWRIVNWSFGLRQALDAPILGYGPGQSALSSEFNLEMHNIFLETFFEGGIFGLTAFLLCLAGLIRIHRRLPCQQPNERYARALTNGFGLALLLAVSFSTSFVDQLMSFLIYLLLLAVASVPAEKLHLTNW